MFFPLKYIQLPRGLKMISNSLPLLNYPFNLSPRLYWQSMREINKFINYKKPRKVFIQREYKQIMIKSEPRESYFGWPLIFEMNDWGISAWISYQNYILF